MKYCLNSRQDNKTLEKADIIFFLHKDFDSFIPVQKRYPNKTYIAIVLFLEEDVKKKLQTYRELTDNLIVGFTSSFLLEDIEWCKDNNIKFMLFYPIDTYAKFNNLKKIGSSAAYITGELIKNMNFIEKNKKNMLIIACPNVCQNTLIPKVNGLYENWIRPEDEKWYSKGIDAYYFSQSSLDRERTLLDIYSKQKFEGNLNLLFDKFYVNVDNRLIAEEAGEIRSNCREKCQQGGRCKFCENIVNFSRALTEEKLRGE